MSVVVGVDEVGRGSWAGPLVAGAVILKRPIAGLKDSKKLSKKQREELSTKIYKSAYSIGLGWVTPTEVDEIGLTESVRRSMELAVQGLGVKFDEVIVDGNYNYLSKYTNSHAEIGADSLYSCVSAASIVAKVARDNYMHQIALKYPGYGFENNVGYGTKVHSDAIRQHGVCDLHRLSFTPIKLAIKA